ncbi:hypothetical protein JCM33374_g6464 [Metschnikowia sp. JCM 33374]|nr:hypothetical protein JCM33374_g6464 [Metschnikowia sp. JCM 33374]
MSGFWLRTFASRSNKDLWIGCGIATFATFVICTLVGLPGFLAVWAGYIEVGDANGYNAFFILLETMPRWVVAFVLIFTICLSTCTFDSLQSAMVSTISNDLFRNKIKMIYIRGLVVVVMIPTIVLVLPTMCCELFDCRYGICCGDSVHFSGLSDSGSGLSKGLT